jgi:hypothetical protein
MLDIYVLGLVTLSELLHKSQTVRVHTQFQSPAHNTIFYLLLMAYGKNMRLLFTVNCYQMHLVNVQTNLDLRNTTVGYGFHFQHRNSRTFPIDSLGMCRTRLSERISKYQQLKKKSAATALSIVLTSAHIQMT